MATAATVTTDWTTCPICLEVFDNPKSLPCIHGFCLKCLEQYFRDKMPGDEVPCPLCRKEFQIPPDGLCGLQHHFFIQHLVDARNVSSKSTDEVPCQACLEANEENGGSSAAATMYCVDCGEYLCDRCSRPHTRTTMKGGAHQVRPVGAGLEQELLKVRGSYCDKHKDKQVELYCHDCNENICVLCFAVKHRLHQTVEVPEMAETLKPRIENDDELILSSMKAVRQRSDKTKEERAKSLSHVESVEKMVVKAGKAVKRLVDRQVSECLQKLQSVKTECTKQAEIVQEQLQLMFMKMDSFHTYSHELLNKGRPCDVTRAAVELHKRATELLNNDVTTVQYRPPHVTFTPADVTQVTPSQLIGKLSVVAVGHVLHTLPENWSVLGVTSLDNLLYVLRVENTSEQIEVYDMDSYRLQRSLTVPGLTAMADMTACAHNSCAYISDRANKCIHRVGLPHGADVTNWPVNDKPAGLSVTDTHSVLVTSNKVRKIKEFSTHGKLLRQIQLPQDVMSPRHTVQLSDKQFIVSHGAYADPVRRVCLIGSDGHVVKTYGGPKGSGSQQMTVPCHLAVDTNGFVFVADVNNYRVLLLSPELTYVRDVVSRDQLKWNPERLFLDVQRRRLYVADSNWPMVGRVVVVSV